MTITYSTTFGYYIVSMERPFTHTDPNVRIFATREAAERYVRGI